MRWAEGRGRVLPLQRDPLKAHFGRCAKHGRAIRFDVLVEAQVRARPALAATPNVALRVSSGSRRSSPPSSSISSAACRLGIALVPALYDGPRIAKVRIPDFDATLRGPHRGRDVAGLHPFNGQDVAVEVEGACSTGCPAWTHASIPPRSGRIFLNPACFRCLAATAADASFGHAQYTTISSSRE